MSKLQEINKDFIAVHKQEYFYANMKSIVNLSEMLQYIHTEMMYNQNYDIKDYEQEELEKLLDISKQYIQNLEYLIKIKRRSY